MKPTIWLRWFSLILTYFLVSKAVPANCNTYRPFYNPDIEEEATPFAIRMYETNVFYYTDIQKIIEFGRQRAKDKVTVDVDVYSKRITEMIGHHSPEPGHYEKKGIFNRISQAYNSRLVEDKVFNESYYHGSMITNAIAECRALQAGIVHFLETNDACEKHLQQKKDDWKAYSDQKKSVAFALIKIDQFDKAVVIPQCTSKSFEFARNSVEELFLSAYNDCLYGTLHQFDILADFDRYRVNYRKADPDAPMGPINRMLKDTEEIMTAIEENLNELQKRLNEAKVKSPKTLPYWEGLVKDFQKRLVTAPYDQLWGGGSLQKSSDIIDDARAEWEKLKTITKDFSKYPFHEYRKDLDKFNMEVGGSYVEEQWTKISEAWQLLEVDQIGDGVVDSLDPVWDYQLTNPLHKLRVGWDYLDKISEEIKCHLKKTYWFDLRNETLKKTQVTFEKGKIFGHFSRTLYQTCRTNDTDIIGRCNVDNYEICRPMIHSEKQEDYIAETGDLSIYRPKWVFTRIDTDPEGIFITCEGEKTWIIPLNLCRCGVRMDCGSDLNVDIKCPLQPNDNLRKQCKGSVGYPCNSLPFAPGRHHASCVFSYCDVSRNSCEEYIDSH